MPTSSEVVICSAVRTPLGAFQGSLSSLAATTLGAKAIAGAMEQAKLSPDAVDQVYMGMVLQAGVGQAPARRAALGAGISEHTPCTTVNKVCGSGMESVVLAARMIALGEAQVVVAGGMESMSNVPYALPNARTGYRMGHGELTDLMIHDGLWDPYNDFHMGRAAELCAREKKISREAQDAFSVQSTKRAIEATKSGQFSAEIVPVEVPQRRGEALKVTQDDGPLSAKPEKIAGLRPAFEREGTVTAGNASSISDGASALVLMSREAATRLGAPILARVRGWGGAARKPEWFTMAPSDAIRASMKHAGTSIEDISRFEINEAFAVVTLANNQELGLSEDKVNVRGGAVCLGHPLGASGARILTTLLHTLKSEDLALGCASLCIGGGEGIAVVVEREA